MSAGNPRNRNQLAQRSDNSQPATLKAIPTLRTGDAAIDAFAAAVKEAIEVWRGARGNPFEKVLTARDLRDLGLSGQTLTYGTPEDGVGIPVRTPGGSYVTLSIDSFARGIMGTLAYRNLMKRVDDKTRFDDLPERIRQLLLGDIADEAAARGADIRRIEEKIQTSLESLAYVSTEVTAAFDGNVAGVRQLMFAYANANRAQAGLITQVRARLNDFGGPGVTVEQVLKATADRTTGLAAEYFVKLAAGKAIAGISLAATEDPDGNTDSAFIVQADRFAIVMPSTVIPDPNNPPAALIPFGVDATGVYINGQVRINASGQTIQSVGRRVQISASTAGFKLDTNGTPTPGSISFSAELTGGLAGTPSFAVVSGSATLSGSVLYPGNMASDTITVRATVVMDGVAYHSDITVYRVRDGTNGRNGNDGIGQKGERGSVQRYLYGAGFDDYAATQSLPGQTPVIGDTVTFSTATTAVTRYWSGYGWVNPGVTIDGNLLVSGTVSAGKIAAGNMLGVNVVGSNRVQVLGNGGGAGWDCSTAFGPLQVRQFCDLLVYNEGDGAQVFQVFQNAKQVYINGTEALRKGVTYSCTVNGVPGTSVRFD